MVIEIFGKPRATRIECPKCSNKRLTKAKQVKLSDGKMLYNILVCDICEYSKPIKSKSKLFKTIKELKVDNLLINSYIFTKINEEWISIRKYRKAVSFRKKHLSKVIEAVEGL